MTVISKQSKIWEEDVMICGESEGNEKKFNFGMPVIRQRFELGTF